jgi:hypothetical protein
LVYFPDIIIVNTFQTVVVCVAAKISTEFFIRTPLDAAAAAGTGFYFCDHLIGLMVVTDNLQSIFKRCIKEEY